MKKTSLAILLTIVSLLIIGYTFVPSIRTSINKYVFLMESIDQETDYQNIKMVEDTARALITNYESAKLEYENYKGYIGSDDKVKEQRALDAKTSANMTVSKYNNYLTENQYIFRGNLPNNIPLKLEKLGD